MWKPPYSEPPPDPQPTEVVPEPAPWWEETIWAFMADFATVFVLAISVYVAIRALEAARKDHRRQRKHDRLSVRPYICFLRKENPDNGGAEISVYNSGLGPAIIRNVGIFLAEGPGVDAYVSGQMNNPVEREIGAVLDKLLDTKVPGGFKPDESPICSIRPDSCLNPNDDPVLIIGVYNKKWRSADRHEVSRRLCHLKFAFDYESMYGERFGFSEPHRGPRP